MPTLYRMPALLTIRSLLIGLLLTLAACSDDGGNTGPSSPSSQGGEQNTEQNTEQGKEQGEEQTNPPIGPVSATDTENADLLFRHFNQYVNPAE